MNLNELAGRVIKVSLAKRALSTLPAGMDRTASPSLSPLTNGVRSLVHSMEHRGISEDLWQRRYFARRNGRHAQRRRRRLIL